MGFGAGVLIGPGYWAATGAMIIIIILMVLLNAVHPPAVSTALGFAFNAGPENNLVLFGLGVGLIVGLVLLQKLVQQQLVHFRHDSKVHL